MGENKSVYRFKKVCVDISSNNNIELLDLENRARFSITELFKKIEEYGKDVEISLSVTTPLELKKLCD